MQGIRHPIHLQCRQLTAAAAPRRPDTGSAFADLSSALAIEPNYAAVPLDIASSIGDSASLSLAGMAEQSSDPVWR